MPEDNQQQASSSSKKAASIRETTETDDVLEGAMKRLAVDNSSQALAGEMNRLFIDDGSSKHLSREQKFRLGSYLLIYATTHAVYVENEAAIQQWKEMQAKLDAWGQDIERIAARFGFD